MANTRTFFRSFAGGEISPEMYGRIDDVHFQTGAALLRNFIATPQGPAENRPGTTFVRATKSNGVARLIPFTYSTTQTMVLELGNQYMRFHTQGATLLSGGVPYEIATPYVEADLFDIHYVQSGDVVTLVHPNYAPRELRRISATNWTLTVITFASGLNAPGAPTVTAYRGQTNVITSITLANPGVFQCNTDHNLAIGDSVYISGVAASMTQIPDGFYLVYTKPTSAQFSLKLFDTGAVVNTTAYTPYTSGGTVQASVRVYDIDNYYVVTAVGADGISESVQSGSGNVVNNLYVSGSYNTLSWTASAGATRYNVYKRQSGLYGYIGQTNTTTFVDNNIAPDLGITPPIADPVFASTNNYPGAVSYFEQRRVFAGTNNEPQNIWFTKTGTESDMSYSIPTEDTDRVAIRVAAREANTIRHIVPLTQLLLLTSAAEWRVSPINSDSITPSTISVRPQSYIGANNVQPYIVNNSVVYCGARGGHVRELGYSWQSSGFITGDLSIRAPHLFDGYALVDMAFAKAPRQILWFVSNTGKLLGLTYIPEQQVGAWHQHDTDGVFESCTAVAEGDEDALYVVVRRMLGSTTVRYVERMASRRVTALEDCIFTDSSLTYNGTNTTATTMTVTGGTTWGPSEALTITASAATFTVGTSDVNDAIVLVDTDGSKYRCTIQSVASTTMATVRVDRTLPIALQAGPTITWEFARDSVTGLTHLEGKTVSILADGAVVPQELVVGGTVTLQRAATKICVGLPYDADLQTLPMALNIDGYGQGRMKNVNKAWLRVYRSSGIFVGPDAEHLVEAKQRTTEPYGTPPTLKSDEILVMLTPLWAASGQVFVRQSDPLPLTIVGMTAEVSIGG